MSTCADPALMLPLPVRLPAVSVTEISPSFVVMLALSTASPFVSCTVSVAPAPWMLAARAFTLVVSVVLVSALTVSRSEEIRPAELTLPRLAFKVMSPVPTLMRLAFVRLPLLSVSVTSPLFVVMSLAATARSPSFCNRVKEAPLPEMVAVILPMLVFTVEDVPARTVSVDPVMVPLGEMLSLVELSVTAPVPALMSPDPVRLPAFRISPSPVNEISIDPFAVVMFPLATIRSSSSVTVRDSPSPVMSAVRLSTSVNRVELLRAVRSSRPPVMVPVRLTAPWFTTNVTVLFGVSTA